jgi:hypothetical protein
MWPAGSSASMLDDQPFQARRLKVSPSNKQRSLFGLTMEYLDNQFSSPF